MRVAVHDGDRGTEGLIRAIAGFAILVGLWLAGEGLVLVTGLPLPGSIVGMLALTLLVQRGTVPVALVRPAADLLVRHLALFFVPAGAAMLAHLGVLGRHLVPIAVAGAASLLATLLVIGVVTQRLGRDE